MLSVNSGITAHDVADYFLYLDHLDDAADGISNLKIQKLVYYAYGFYAASFSGKKLFNENILAWTHGPVIPELYYQYRQHGKNCLPFNPETPHFEFSGEEKQFLQQIYDDFGQYSAWRLRDMTHEETPWRNHFNGEYGKNIIPHEEIYTYFQGRLDLLGNIIPPDAEEERRDWGTLASQGLADAYDDDEFEYTLEDVTWINPLYDGK